MAIRVGINGFGRIGRLVFRRAIELGGFDFVSINDLTDAPTLAHLLKYDSVHGRFNGTVDVDGNDLIINGDRLRITAERDPANLDWTGVDVVIESTGIFRTREQVSNHLKNGAKKVVLTVPAKDEIDATIVLGVNDDVLTGEEKIVSNASCTTNCLAPMVRVLHDAFGLEKGLMTTVHSYTNDQRLLDLPHKDLRRARSALNSLIPTTTGSATAITLIYPELKGKLNGHAVRVPLLNASLTDCVFEVGRPTTVEEVNALFKAASEGDLKGILGYEERPLVSCDYTNDPRSSIVDAPSTMVVDGTQVKVFAWYDNEWGYCCRLADVTRMVAAQL